MFLIVDRGLHTVRVLSGEETEALKSYYARHGAISDADAQSAEEVFSDVQVREQWLACDCLGNGLPIVRRPLLCPAAKTTLRRMPSPPRPAHSGECCFSVGRAGRGEGDPAADVVPDRNRLVHDREFGLHRPFAHGRPALGPAGGPRGDGGARPRRPTHARLLLTLLEQASLNRWHANALPERLSEQFSRVRAAAAGLRLTEACTVGEVLVNRPAMIGAEREAAQPMAGVGPGRISLRGMIAAKAHDWPANSRPHGFLCTVASAFADRTVTFLEGDYKRNLLNRPHVFSESRRDSTGPYIALISYAMRCPGDIGYHAIGAYAQPCVSIDDCRPVDSGYERRTLIIMTGLQSELHAQGAAGFSILKPLFDEFADMPDGTRQPCRPDFVVEVLARDGTVRRRIVVETMGRDTPEYETTKRNTHGRMRRLWGGCEVLEHDCLTRGLRAEVASGAAFRQRLADAVRRAAL